MNVILRVCAVNTASMREDPSDVTVRMRTRWRPTDARARLQVCVYCSRFDVGLYVQKLFIEEQDIYHRCNNRQVHKTRCDLSFVMILV